jgi:hypothetical protein
VRIVAYETRNLENKKKLKDATHDQETFVRDFILEMNKM